MTARKIFLVGRGLCWLLLLLLAGLGLSAWMRFAPSRLEPGYEGRRLGQWLREHPRDYQPVMQAVGTNALPYLLAELQITDPAWLKWAEGALGEFGPFWEPARSRRYHARIALQILDTNALPTLLEASFAKPIRLAEGDLGFEAAFALTWLASPPAQEAIQQELASTMRSHDADTRRNACLVVSAGNFCKPINAAQLAALTRDTEPAVRAAAVLAARFPVQDEAVLLPAVIERLTDEHAIIRQLAANALQGRGTNAVAALPALKVALTAEPTRPRGSDRLDDRFERVRAPASVCAAVQHAIRAIEKNDPRPAAARK
jgi:hypothetical protein